MVDITLIKRQQRSSSAWSGYCLSACALLSILSSPLLDQSRIFHDYFYINWRVAYFTMSLSIVFSVILIRNSRGIRRDYWWAYVAGVLSFLLSGTTLAWAGLMTGIFQGEL